MCGAVSGPQLTLQLLRAGDTGGHLSGKRCHKELRQVWQMSCAASLTLLMCIQAFTLSMHPIGRASTRPGG